MFNSKKEYTSHRSRKKRNEEENENNARLWDIFRENFQTDFCVMTLPRMNFANKHTESMEIKNLHTISNVLHVRVTIVSDAMSHVDRTWCVGFTENDFLGKETLSIPWYTRKPHNIMPHARRSVAYDNISSVHIDSVSRLSRTVAHLFHTAAKSNNFDQVLFRTKHPKV